MEDKKIIALMEGYAAGNLSEEDSAAFIQWYSQAGLEEFHRIFSQCHLQPGSLPGSPDMPEDFRTRLEQSIHSYEVREQEDTTRPIQLFRRYRLGWAAAVLLLMSVGAYYFMHSRPASPVMVVDDHPLSNDVAPGTTKAVLTLADGSRITLDSARFGELAIQGKTSVMHKNGDLSYIGSKDPIDKMATTDVLYNTLTTGRGEQSPPLTLADGTRVWLNALSSIRFPVAFTGNLRQVEVTGEAFFDIAKDQEKPFRVTSKDMTVEVLGTQFNINCYPDEPDSRTTLVRGRVKVIAGQELVLEPGQQASVHAGIHLVKDADIDQVVAWKTGLFNFDHADLQTVLRQLSRWYDIEVKFEGQIPVRSFHGKITRDLNLSQVIRLLQDVKVKFRIEGRTLIITP